MPDIRKETDSLGVIEVPADQLWGIQRERGMVSQSPNQF
jgi:fumarate hydratase class II